MDLDLIENWLFLFWFDLLLLLLAQELRPFQPSSFDPFQLASLDGLSELLGVTALVVHLVIQDELLGLLYLREVLLLPGLLRLVSELSSLGVCEVPLILIALLNLFHHAIGLPFE